VSGTVAPAPAARILVADDDADILALVAFRLERSGYEVIRAGDGAEALMLALEEAPALAVLDVSMPKLDGYEVTRRIRADERTCRLPVILLTARVLERDVALGYEAGADDYMKKPFSPQELRVHVQAILARGSTAGPPAGPR
jgi:DNA-binding response OmpR family regulator